MRKTVRHQRGMVSSIRMESLSAIAGIRSPSNASTGTSLEFVPPKPRWPFAFDPTPRPSKKALALQKKKKEPARQRVPIVKYELKEGLPSNLLLRVRNEDGKTIAAHQYVIQTKGSVMFGRLGPAIGSDFQNILNTQVANKTTTYLFVTIREGWGGPFITFKCNLLHTYDEIPSEKIEFIPAYMLGKKSSVSTWFEVSSCSQMTKEEMNRIYVESSKRGIMSVMQTSSTMFRVVLAEEAIPSQQPQ
jgi:hypothetical protein